MHNTIKQEWMILITLAISAMILIYGVPLMQISIGSLYSNSVAGQDPSFIAFKNYYLVWKDSAFIQATLASTVFTFLSVVFQLLVALSAALITRRKIPGVNLLRWMFVAPYFLPTVVVVIAWRFFSDPFVGLLPQLLNSLGIESPDLRSPAVALPVMVIVATYEAFPFAYIILLSRLLQIPTSLYEVAELSGASRWYTFISVTLPHIKLTLAGIFLIRFLITFLKFDVPWLVYASQSTSYWGDTLAVYIYRAAFEKPQSGHALAASLSVLLTAWAIYGLYAFVSKKN